MIPLCFWGTYTGNEGELSILLSEGTYEGEFCSVSVSEADSFPVRLVFAGLAKINRSIRVTVNYRHEKTKTAE